MIQGRWYRIHLKCMARIPKCKTHRRMNELMALNHKAMTFCGIMGSRRMRNAIYKKLHPQH